MVDSSTERMAGTSRRAVVRGAAWTVPVIAAAQAAPAFAASTCADPRQYRLDWGTSTYSHPTANDSYATVTSGGNPTVYVHFNTVFRGSGAGDGTVNNVAGGEARNLSVPSATAGSDVTRDPAITNLGGLGANERGLRLQQVSPAGNANRQDLTVSFRTGTSATSPLATNIQALSFWIVDIDNLASPAYSDRVALAATAPFSATRDTNIVGAGTSVAETGTGVGPWRNSVTGNQNENAAGARVLVSFADDYAARMSQFTLSYWTNTGATAPATGQYHRIYLSDFTFKTCP